MSETIDITPVGLQTPEGQKRVAEAQEEWNASAHALANAVTELNWNRPDEFTKDETHQILALIGARNRKQEEFLRAVAGKPKLYPANVNGKRVMVTIPED